MIRFCLLFVVQILFLLSCKSEVGNSVAKIDSNLAVLYIRVDKHRFQPFIDIKMSDLSSIDYKKMTLCFKKYKCVQIDSVLMTTFADGYFQMQYPFVARIFIFNEYASSGNHSHSPSIVCRHGASDDAHLPSLFSGGCLTILPTGVTK